MTFSLKSECGTRMGSRVLSSSEEGLGWAPSFQRWPCGWGRGLSLTKLSPLPHSAPQILWASRPGCMLTCGCVTALAWLTCSCWFCGLLTSVWPPWVMRSLVLLSHHLSFLCILPDLALLSVWFRSPDHLWDGLRPLGMTFWLED